MAVKQTIPSNTNQTKSLTFSKLRGVDFSSSPFEVSTSRAVHMKNMINEDGVNHKRPGHTSELSINNDGRKIIDVCKLGDYYFVAKTYIDYTGMNNITIYKWDGLEYRGIMHEDHTYKIPDKIFIPISHNKILIAPACNCILKFDEETNTYSTEFADSVIYIPTTTISINASEDGESSDVTYEEINAFTNKRKNSLIGRKVDTVKVTFLPFDTSDNILSARLSAGFGGANISYYDNSFHYQGTNGKLKKELSFRIVPGKYSIYASVTTTNLYPGADTDDLCDENGTLLGEDSGEGRRYIDINEDVIIYVKGV